MLFDRDEAHGLVEVARWIRLGLARSTLPGRGDTAVSRVTMGECGGSEQRA